MNPSTMHDSTSLPPQRYSLRRGAGRWSVQRILFWIERSRQRAVLAELDDERLRDLGLSRQEVLCECSKRFWQ